MATPQQKMVKAAVARGRTLHVGTRKVGPGALVELPADEADRLMALGFLHNPQAEEIPVGDGPNFRGPNDGVVRPT